jgi:hypothetical protein
VTSPPRRAVLAGLALAARAPRKRRRRAVGWSNDQKNVVVIGAGSGGGLFVYNPVPGKGNLICAIVPAAGVDPYGNAYGQGFNLGVWNAAGQPLQHFGIDDNGNVYLVDATQATRIYLDPSRRFIGMYSGPPAAGNLIASVAAAAGADPQGNAFDAGFTTYEPGTGIITMNGNELDFASTPSGLATACRIEGTPGMLGLTSGLDAGDGGTVYSAMSIFDDDTFFSNGNAGVVIGSSSSNGFPIRSLTTILELHGRLGMTSQGSDPATPAGGGIVYVKNGALFYKGSGGTVTQVAPA